MRHKLIYFLLLVFCIPIAARADDASKMAKIQEFFKVAKIDQLSARTLQLVENQAKSGMMQQMLGVKLSAEQQQRANDLSDKVAKIVSGALSWDALEPEYAKMYADAYTEQQIDDLLAFYKSSTGQVMVEKMPILMQQANGVVQQRLATVMPQLQKLVTDSIAAEMTTTQQRKPSE